MTLHPVVGPQGGASLAEEVVAHHFQACMCVVHVGVTQYDDDCTYLFRSFEFRWWVYAHSKKSRH